MTTTNSFAPTQTSIDQAIQFIQRYHFLEKQNVKTGFDFIRRVFAKEGKSGTDHLCDQWKFKKKIFSSFYLNLGFRKQIAIMHEFGIVSDDDKAYLEGWEKADGDPSINMYWVTPPALCKSFQSLLLFFNNHGIQAQPYQWLNLTDLPKQDSKCFGNSYNWAGYILTLDRVEQKRIIGLILTHYKN